MCLPQKLHGNQCMQYSLHLLKQIMNKKNISLNMDVPSITSYSILQKNSKKLFLLELSIPCLQNYPIRASSSVSTPINSPLSQPS
eukprot:c22026_g1_i1 orf=159-413(+)